MIILTIPCVFILKTFFRTSLSFCLPYQALPFCWYYLWLGQFWCFKQRWLFWFDTSESSISQFHGRVPVVYFQLYVSNKWSFIWPQVWTWLVNDAVFADGRHVGDARLECWSDVPEVWRHAGDHQTGQRTIQECGKCSSHILAISPWATLRFC